MKPNTYAKRSRHHSHSNSRGRPNQQFSAPLSDSGDHYDQRMKATAQQQVMKYLNMARDAASSGDRVAAEGYYQHADHYQRVLNTFRPPVRAPQAPLPEASKDAPPQDANLTEVATQTVAPETFTPETVAPETFTPETVAPETFAPETVVSEPKPAKVSSKASKPVKQKEEAVQPPEGS